MNSLCLCICPQHPPLHTFPVFVRKGKHGKAELVLLDHGLYDYLQPVDRVNLCQLYKAIILRDEDKMKLFSKNLGVDGNYLS